MTSFDAGIEAEYERIRLFYKGRRAARSGHPYMRHIDEGLRLVRHLSQDVDVARAWVLHPLFQDDQSLREMFVLSGWTPTYRTTILAMEYRSVANAYTSTMRKGEPKLSALPGVNEMLIADKVQNHKDAVHYVYPKVSDEEHLRLIRYFQKWFQVLQISSEQLVEYESVLAPP